MSDRLHFNDMHSYQGFNEAADLGDIIAPPSGDVLPRLSVWSLADALRRLPDDELALSLRTKLVPLISIPGLKLFAACDKSAQDMARADGLKVVAESSAAEFIDAARRAHGPRILDEATNGLARRTPQLSASRRLTIGQTIVIAATALSLAVAIALLPGAFVWTLLSFMAGLFFLSVIALRLLCLMPRPRSVGESAPRLTDAELPAYSVLVPLFRETSVLGQLLNALTRLDYPVHKLDIKLILEESDILMQRALLTLPLPPQFDVLVVPSGKPQTKPRALNYALQFARGQLLTIFDAEDIPEPVQLRRAAEAFAVCPEDVACLQAQLVFYNPNENWLTRQFTIEYATLFSLILPALAAHHLPLPLGGTSNHFRTNILRRIGAWDPYNVTEDADLGMRLARLGYDTGTIEGRTYEEANVRLLNWIRQRARWMKGFLATWLVHMRDPRRAHAELGPAGFWSMQGMTLGVFASALLHPFCMLAVVVVTVTMPPGQRLDHPSLIALAGLSLLILVLGYAVTMIAGHRAIRDLGISRWWLPILTMPAYWMLMSAAAWLALWQFIVAPFHWNKTEHGLSAFQRRRRKAKADRSKSIKRINHSYTD
ncbi:MAG: glycosyltransferase [Alphaproteobacteria bacterium]|nr:glycosyltransferase [Alphaproteobacteria bacterium]